VVSGSLVPAILSGENKRKTRHTIRSVVVTKSEDFQIKPVVEVVLLREGQEITCRGKLTRGYFRKYDPCQLVLYATRDGDIPLPTSHGTTPLKSKEIISLRIVSP
jgi:hypothetical protein